MKRVIHWFRRDLRVSDNTALYHASKDAEEVVPVYILSTWKGSHPWSGPNRQAFLCGCLASLSRNLAALGGSLIIRAGDPRIELERLVQETGAEAIYTNRGVDPFAVSLEAQLEKDARQRGIGFRRFLDVTIQDPDAVLTQSGQPFRVFTPYARAWHLAPRPAVWPRLERVRTPAGLPSEPLPGLDHWRLEPEAAVIQPGEKAAHTRLRRFLSGPIFEYGSRRNSPAQAVNSRLSQDLRWGILSPRQVFAAAERVTRTADAVQRRSVNAFLNELVWREFYMQILRHYPEVLHTDFNGQFGPLEWNHDEPAFQRWCEGTTGFPIVDAGMRELLATGFMHNRLRMITAMFLTKDLHLHWKQGERFFSQKLVDGEIASNNGGWQWSAGIGADAAPYFRIHNPWTQTRNCDPDGTYIKRWVPELRGVEAAEFLRPPTAPLAKGYPLPMVNHDREREITLERFNRVRRSQTMY
ncbi:MAG: deoxyribodipyrimidine photo-lyase [Verrucomicrobia bacterium]|nr:deoxyribodipyrimidine photo-lyase [Verrucomicrobiota bacterium]